MLKKRRADDEQHSVEETNGFQCPTHDAVPAAVDDLTTKAKKDKKRKLLKGEKPDDDHATVCVDAGQDDVAGRDKLDDTGCWDIDVTARFTITGAAMEHYVASSVGGDAQPIHADADLLQIARAPTVLQIARAPAVLPIARAPAVHQRLHVHQPWHLHLRRLHRWHSHGSRHRRQPQ
eukprot:m.83058 g.83058  ORF g.83058 m.83058 type:complete len:177 (+) comp8147_c1_seq3:243-773(+)